MKNVALLALLTLGLSLGAVSCKGTYQDPFGGKTDWEFDPDTGDKKKAYEELEKALADNLKAQTEAAINGNVALGELAASNIEKITEAKRDLGYDPPKSMQVATAVVTGQAA